MSSALQSRSIFIYSPPLYPYPSFFLCQDSFEYFVPCCKSHLPLLFRVVVIPIFTLHLLLFPFLSAFHSPCHLACACFPFHLCDRSRRPHTAAATGGRRTRRGRCQQEVTGGAPLATRSGSAADAPGPAPRAAALPADDAPGRPDATRAAAAR